MRLIRGRKRVAHIAKELVSAGGSVYRALEAAGCQRPTTAQGEYSRFGQLVRLAGRPTLAWLSTRPLEPSQAALTHLRVGGRVRAILALHQILADDRIVASAGSA